MFGKKRIIILVGIVIVLSACSEFKKVQKSNDYNLKYEKAVEYFGQEDFFKALQLFDELVPYVRGTERAEKVNYYYAYCYYYQQDYILASYFFKKFFSEYPRSKNAEECFFMNAYCKYLDSPIYSLDQTSTYEAIKELQLFANYYPGSDSLETCNNLIDQLRFKLQKKDFEIARLYYKTEDYLAAITAFNNVLKDYPETIYREEILFLIAKTYYYYALNSVPSKQLERYEATKKAAGDFKVQYPDSDYIKDLNNFLDNALLEIKRINESKNGF